MTLVKRWSKAVAVLLVDSLLQLPHSELLLAWVFIQFLRRFAISVLRLVLQDFKLCVLFYLLKLLVVLILFSLSPLVKLCVPLSPQAKESLRPFCRRLSLQVIFLILFLCNTIWLERIPFVSRLTVIDLILKSIVKRSHAILVQLLMAIATLCTTCRIKRVYLRLERALLQFGLSLDSLKLFFEPSFLLAFFK